MTPIASGAWTSKTDKSYVHISERKKRFLHLQLSICGRKGSLENTIQNSNFVRAYFQEYEI